MFALISDWLQDQAAQVVLGTAALGALGKWVIVPLWKFARAGSAAITFIQHELNENSGRSLRDYMVRTDQRIEYLFNHLGVELPPELRSPPPENKESTP